jgi:hypothetical protein
VLAVSPAGTLNPGDTVTVTHSSGPEMATLPDDLTGRPAQDAADDTGALLRRGTGLGGLGGCRGGLVIGAARDGQGDRGADLDPSPDALDTEQNAAVSADASPGAEQSLPVEG